MKIMMTKEEEKAYLAKHHVPIKNHAAANYASGAGLRSTRSHTFDVPLPDGKVERRKISFAEPTTVHGEHHFQRGVSDGERALWRCTKCKEEIAFVLDTNVCPHACVVDGEVVMPEHAGQYMTACPASDHTLTDYVVIA